MATLIVYPDPGSGATTCSGPVFRENVNESFASIIAGAGTGGETGTFYIELDSFGVLTNNFRSNLRSIATFDTSSLTSLVTVSSAVFSAYGQGDPNKANQYSPDDPNVHVVGATPASNNDLISSDYGQTGSTTFGNMVYADIVGNAYNDVTLNANGINNINKTGISAFAIKSSWDLNNSFTGTWAVDKFMEIDFESADAVGTSKDPKLTIEYAIPPYNPFHYYKTQGFQ